MMDEFSCEPATDRTFNDIIWDEFFMLMAFGGTYSFTHTTPWKIFTVVNYTLMYTSVITTMILLAYTSYLTRDNMSLLSQACHIFIIGAVAITATSVISSKRLKLIRFRNFFDNPYGLARYSKTPFFDDKIKTTNRKKKVFIFTWIFLYGNCGLIGISQPIINTLGGPGEVKKVRGVWSNLPFAMWFPYYDLEKDDTAWLVAYMLESLFTFYVTIMVTASISICFLYCETLLDQLKLNIYGVRNITKRANENLAMKYPGCKRKQMKQEYEECFYDCLVQNVEHHLKTKKCFEAFMDIASIPIAVPFYGGALLLGMAMITLTSDDDPRPGPKVFAAALAFSEAYNMYLLCNAGQEFQDLSWELFESLYFTEWYNRSTKCTKALMLMRSGCSRPFKMTAARMLNLNMALFGDLVQSAYSIFNLKAASEGD